MDPITTSIIAALSAGAVAAAKDVSSAAVKDAYAGLKRILTDGYKATFFPSLEKNPASKAVGMLAAEEIADTEANTDKAVAEAAAKVIEEIEADDGARAAIAESGISIANLKAQKEIIVDNVHASGSLSIENVESKDGGITIQNVGAGQKGN